MSEVSPQDGARDSLTTEVVNRKSFSKSEIISSKHINTRKGRLASFASTINPLPALGFRRRRESLSQEELPSATKAKGSPSSTGFTAVASKVSGRRSGDTPHRRSKTVASALLIDPDAISEKTHIFLRQADVSSPSMISSKTSPIVSRSKPLVPTNIDVSSISGAAARSSVRVLPQDSDAIHTLLPNRAVSAPKLNRARTKAVLGNRGHAKCIAKERRRPTMLYTSMSVEDLNLAVAFFLIAMTLAEFSGKVLLSVIATVLLALGLNSWFEVWLLRKRKLRRTKMRKTKQSSRRRKVKGKVSIDIR